MSQALLRQAMEALELCNKHGFVLADHEDTISAALSALSSALEAGEEPKPSNEELDVLAKKHTTVQHQITHGWGAVPVSKLDHRSFARAVLAASPVPADTQGDAPTHAQMMAGYEVACRFKVYEAQAFNLAEQMFKAFRDAALSATPEAGKQ